MEKQDKIFVAGSETLIGSSLVNTLREQGYSNLVGVAADEPILTDAVAVDAFFNDVRPSFVFLTGGKSGGIHTNQQYPADLILNNLLVETSVIDSAYKSGAEKLLYLGSSCCYPKQCPQPMNVASLMTGPLEPTNEAYAIAKISGIKLCQAYRQQYGVNFVCGIPGDAFGPGDEFNPNNSHVIAALIKRFHESKIETAPAVQVWGTGTPKREFIFADDLADACIFLMKNYDSSEPINIGSGNVMEIGELALAIKEVVEFQGDLSFDHSKPDGMPLKALDSSVLLNMGWQAKTPFRTGLRETYEWFLEIEGAHAR